MKKFKTALFVILSCSFTFSFIGCSNETIDPTQIGRFQPVPSVNVILDSLGVADEPDAAYVGAEEPRPEDLINYDQDYVFGVGDILRISIYELRREGFPFVDDYSITESGRISIPDVGQVRAVGLTEKKLEDEIKDILSPHIIKEPSVHVMLLSSQKRQFSIYGWGLGQTGRFPIPRHDDFRLTDAIAVAGDVGQFNVTYIYVSREVEVEKEAILSPSVYEAEPIKTDIPELKTIEPGQSPSDQEKEILDLISPYSKVNRNGIVITSSEMVADKELESLALPEGFDNTITAQANPEPSSSGDGRIEWIVEDGKWKPVMVDDGKAPAETVTEAAQAAVAEQSSDFTWDNTSKKAMRMRVIRIPVDKLKGGDPRYDIIIRPGDRISVPGDIVGEFYVMGNVNGPGIIQMTGRPMTLKMAIAAAGGLNQIAWPKKVEIVRRLGRNKAGLLQEETVMVDLDKIAKGMQPDFFIKPNDLINVGTHGTSRWLAVLRNAFRATYGFGFIYDRNFATRDFNGSPFPGHMSFDSIF